jgi:hypothetical protein
MCPSDKNVHGADEEKRPGALSKNTLSDECAMHVARILARMASRDDQRAARSSSATPTEWYELHPDRRSELDRDQ